MVAILVWILALNAILGLLLLSYAWKMTKPYRQKQDEYDSVNPSWRRGDLHLWKLHRFLPGAITLLLPRVVLMISLLLSIGVLALILFIGADVYSGKPPSGFRKTILGYAIRGTSRIFIFCSSYRMNVIECDTDYSLYLGKDYRKTQKVPAKPSTIIENHVSWLDNFLIMALYPVRFLTAALMKLVPVVGYICHAVGCVFVTLISPEDRKRVRQVIIDTQM